MTEYASVFGVHTLAFGFEDIQGTESMGVWTPHSAGAAAIAETRDYLSV